MSETEVYIEEDALQALNKIVQDMGKHGWLVSEIIAEVENAYRNIDFNDD